MPKSCLRGKSHQLSLRSGHLEAEAQMGVLSEDESDTSALFTESELDDSDLDFARRRPRAPVAPPRGAPANDARDDAPRFSSEDEEDEPRRAPSPPPAAAPTWVGPSASSGASTRAAAAAAAAPVGRPGGATGGAVPTFSFSHRASDSGIGSARQTSYAPAASSRPPPTAPSSRGGTASAQSSPARRPTAASSSRPNSSNILASVLGIDVERGVEGFDDEDDSYDVASPLRGGKESRRDRAARLAREGTSRRQDRRGESDDVGKGKSLGSLNLAAVAKFGTGARWSARGSGHEIGAWTARQATLAVDGRTTATWLVACAAAQLLGGLVACLWESGGQWAAPGHDLPIAVLTVCAALAGGKGALGSTWRTQAVLHVGHVCALAFALGLDVFVMARMSDVMAATMARPELAANRRAARGGVGLALAAKALALPLSMIHAIRVVWPGRGAPRE